MKLPIYQPEKALCEKSIFLSLTEKDFMFIGLVYVLFHFVFRFFSLDILALLLTFLVIVFSAVARHKALKEARKSRNFSKELNPLSFLSDG